MCLPDDLLQQPGLAPLHTELMPEHLFVEQAGERWQLTGLIDGDLCEKLAASPVTSFPENAASLAVRSTRMNTGTLGAPPGLP
jgi:hypothetical protein